MLPAPMVLPKAHWPVGVVIVVRRLGAAVAAGLLDPVAFCEISCVVELGVISTLSR